MNNEELQKLEQQLDDFAGERRTEAFAVLAESAQRGELALPDARPAVNMHIHTFFSYNAYGYSPLHIAWRARREGLAAAGIVDFDVLDGMQEFLSAARLIDLKASVGLESRVFVPEFAEDEINSPGEPGIAYHMGAGFTTAAGKGDSGAYLQRLRDTSRERTLQLVERVNEYTDPVRLEMQRDVLPLTPNGTATERHVCLAYARKAVEMFPDRRDLERYWRDKLGPEGESADLPDGPGLQALIRSRTMKRGGVGYVLPDRGSFPLMAEMNSFVLAMGAIPTVTWLNGMSSGEQRMDELLRVAMNSGAAAVNIIPDRNFEPGVKDRKLQNLYDVVELARKHGLPVIAGTEMNSPGSKFVDDIDCPELAPLRRDFMDGAFIVCAHSVLQSAAGMGYLSPWARRQLPDRGDRNEFFAEFGRRYDPGRYLRGEDWPPDPDPHSILKTLR